MGANDYPFKVGHSAEERSFQLGYRGAWFRCKITGIEGKAYRTKIALEYDDFPEEKLHWTPLYRKSNKSKEAKMVLMFRPPFPKVYRESQLPDIDTILEEVVVVNDVWKVGDLVDWWCDGCYWFGRLIEKLGDEKFRIKLPPPPTGEGLTYEVSSKDLRPSLDWTQEHGWTVPVPIKQSEKCNSCARVIKPRSLGASQNLTVCATEEGSSELGETDRASVEHIDLDASDGGAGKATCSDGVSNSDVGGAPSVAPRNICGKVSDENNSISKKLKIDQNCSMNSAYSIKTEASILDLEKLLDRVKWMKRVLQSGTSLSNASPPLWEFLEHRPSVPK